ncbi:GNAT family N-acetyltransferase [Microbacterium aureliae]
MTHTDATTTVSRDEAQHRYEIHVDDVLAGFTTFRTDSRGRVLFPHTEVDPAFKGRGLATILVAEAMADSARRGDTIVPHCPFVSKYLRENPVDGLSVDWPGEPHPE